MIIFNQKYKNNHENKDYQDALELFEKEKILCIEEANKWNSEHEHWVTKFQTVLNERSQTHHKLFDITHQLKDLELALEKTKAAEEQEPLSKVTTGRFALFAEETGKQHKREEVQEALTELDKTAPKSK